MLEIRYRKVTGPHRIRRLLLRVRYELRPKVGAQNDILVACFATDKARDVVIDRLKLVHIVAAFDALDALARFNVESLLSKRAEWLKVVGRDGLS